MFITHSIDERLGIECFKSQFHLWAGQAKSKPNAPEETGWGT